MTQDPPATPPADPAIDERWRVRPEVAPIPTTPQQTDDDWSRFSRPGDETVTVRPPEWDRYEQQDPRNFGQWYSRERGELRQQGLQILNGESVDAGELLGNIVSNLIGSAVRSNDASRDRLPGDMRRDREDGVQYDRHGYPSSPYR